MSVNAYIHVTDMENNAPSGGIRVSLNIILLDESDSSPGSSTFNMVLDFADGRKSMDDKIIALADELASDFSLTVDKAFLMPEFRRL